MKFRIIYNGEEYIGQTRGTGMTLSAVSLVISALLA